MFKNMLITNNDNVVYMTEGCTLYWDKSHGGMFIHVLSWHALIFVFVVSAFEPTADVHK